MSDDSEKPFEPSARRIAKAKCEGNVVRSGEFSANLAFLAAAAGIVAAIPSIKVAVFDAVLRAVRGQVPLSECVAIVAMAAAPVACASVAGIVAAAVQNGGFTIRPMVPKAENLNPVTGLRRVLSRETLAHSGRAMLAVTAAIACMAPAIGRSASAMLGAKSLGQITLSGWVAAQRVTFVAGGVGLAFSFIEYAAARTAWLQRLRMSADERKREAKDEEGDAFARGRRRSAYRALLRDAPVRVKEAALVIANPTHVAVALDYRPPEVPVPKVLVRARDHVAAYVRELALLHGVPIVENASLARALYYEARSGDPIPPAHYVAVAEIVVALARNRRMPS